jgi:hypothetical protein
MRTALSNGGLATLALILALAPIACGDDSTGPEVGSEPFSVEITAAGELVMASGTRALTTATVFLQSGANETVGTWTPNQTGGFTGTLRGLAPGSTQLVVRYMYKGVGGSNAEYPRPCVDLWNAIYAGATLSA